MILCNYPTNDGGIECSDSDQCESECLAPEGLQEGVETGGVCSGWTNNYGYFVESGKVTGPVLS